MKSFNLKVQFEHVMLTRLKIYLPTLKTEPFNPESCR